MTVCTRPEGARRAREIRFQFVLRRHADILLWSGVKQVEMATERREDDEEIHFPSEKVKSGRIRLAASSPSLSAIPFRVREFVVCSLHDLP